ncbi:lipopolysaccharide biosynthesis protein [Acidomonas methanolica]|nr:lipopolysaccharide biosynthesis protein [Acidomonas methanolica]
MPEDLPPASGEAGAQAPNGLRRVLRNVAVLLMGRAVNAPLSLAQISLTIHLLGSYGFGLIAMMYAFARMVGDVVDFQSWQVVLHYGVGPLTRGERRSFQHIVAFSLLLDLMSGLVGCMVGMGIAWFGTSLLGWPPGIRLVGTIYMVSVLFMTTATATGVLRLFDRYDRLAMQGTVATICRVIGVLAMLVLGSSIPRLAAIWMMAEATAWAFLSGFAIRELRVRNLLKGFSFSLRLTVADIVRGHMGRLHPGIWRFVFATNFTSTLALTFGHLGTLMVGCLLGPASAGYYRLASQIAAGVAKPVTLIQTTLYPEMARMWRDKATGRLYRLCIQIALSGGVVGCVILAVAFFLGHPLFRLLTGEANPQAVPVMLWLLAAEIVTVWGLPLEPLLFTTRRAGAAIKARALETLLFLPSLFFMVRWYGLGGAGPATLLATITLIGLQLLLVLEARPHDAARDAAPC